MKISRLFRRRLPRLAALALALGGTVPAWCDDTPPVLFSLSTARARPGEKAVLILSVETQVSLKAVSFALDFDETKVRILAITRIQPDKDGNIEPVQAPEDRVSTNWSNVDQVAGNQASEGWAYAELNTPIEDAKLPVLTGVQVPILEIQFLVLPEAEPGFTPVDFKTVGPLNFMPIYFLENQVLAAELAATPQEMPLSSMKGGGIDIIGEVGFFMRADANFDQKRDITDPILGLGFLFSTGIELPCEDSADSNDDGSIDVSDPIFTLIKLFQETGSFPEPEIWGKDPTTDDLGCAVYPGL